MIKAIIVEDEYPLRTLIRKLINDVDPEVEILAECPNIIKAEEAIKKYSPNILFLDVVMPHGTGIDLLERMPNISSEVIFITSYHKYMLDAFQFAAVGYVLKPIDKDKLKIAIDNAKKRLFEKNRNSISSVLKYFDNANTNNKIGIPTQEGIVFVEYKNILRLEGRGSYTKIFFDDGTSIMSSYNLSNVGSVLPERNFFKIHKSHIISLDKVVKYSSKNACVEMNNGDKVPVPKKSKDIFLSLYKITRK